MSLGANSACVGTNLCCPGKSAVLRCLDGAGGGGLGASVAFCPMSQSFGWDVPVNSRRCDIKI